MKRANTYKGKLDYQNDDVQVVRWINLEERKPTKSGSYLITTKSGAVCTAHWYGDKFSSPAGKNAEYWMPLPEGRK